MFGTWKYDPATDEVQNLPKAFDPTTARYSQHQACDRCHEKKLKCDGEKDGCERCLASKRSCAYTQPGARRSRKGHKSRSSPGQSSATNRDDSPASTGTSSTSTTKVKGSKRNKSLKSNGSPTTTNSHTQRLVSRTPAGLEESELDRLDLSALGPDDGFEFSMLSNQYAPATTTSPSNTTAAFDYPAHVAASQSFDGWATTPQYQREEGALQDQDFYYPDQDFYADEDVWPREGYKG